NLRIDWRSGHHTHVINGRTRLMLPGGSQTYRMGFAGTCVSLPSSASIAFTPASASLGGNPVTTRDGKGIPDTVSSCTEPFLGPVEPVDPEDAGTGPYSQLVADIHLPSSVTPGTTLNYTLTLTNTGSDTFTFSSCPAYTEGVDVASHVAYQVTTVSYTLNCGGVSIPAGGTATFAMQIDVPDVTGTAYLAKFVWIMENGPSHTAAVGLP
ncbi:MAG TPA: hypothetical protein VIV12_08755, partial [Streptosporangiaceae bacterium]